MTGNKSDIVKGLNIIHKHFKNLKHINLEMYCDLSFTELIDILKNWKIKHCKLDGTGFYDEDSIESKFGTVILHDCDKHYCIKFKNLRI